MMLFRTIFRHYGTNVQRSMRISSVAFESNTYLMERGVSRQVIDDNPFLLDLNIDTLHHKLEIVKRMRPRHINDFVPLLKIEDAILKDVAIKAAEEYDTIPEKHRIYYLSRELQIEPVTVSKFCLNHEAIFFAEFTGIAKKLKILLDYNVDKMQILQSLYVLKRSKNKLLSRLDELSKRSCDYKPWYFNLSDEDFRNAIDVASGKAQAIPVESPRKLKDRNSQKSTILTEINGMLSCEDELSTHIYYDSLDSVEQLSPAKHNMELLINNGFGLQCIQDNPVVLTLPYAQINDNIQLIKEMRPISIDDFLPLVEVKTRSLQAFVRDVNTREIDLHPIYLFSKKLKIAPAVVSKHFAKHSKLFFYRNFVGLVDKLDVLVAYHVEPMSILTSPNTFSLSASTLETRLKKFKSLGIENILSWMLYDHKRVEISVARRVEEKASFGECADIVDYITKRLNWDAATKENVLKRYPALVKCSTKKVKSHLDYLLNEAHYTVDDINSSASSVFRTNLDELKLRMGELAAIGLVPCKLYAICLDKQRYLDMVWKFCKRKNCPATVELFKSIERRVKNLKME